ncbi:type II toxin-antitoxin system death-on-curing family toxin [bacterium]|nr:MAG: type II toxin-antitoxin system death-on-curing family toxin [bacterium]
MSRKNRTVAAFAKKAGLSSDDALLILEDKIGLQFKKETAVVPKNQIRAVEVALGISKKESPEDKTIILHPVHIKEEPPDSLINSGNRDSPVAKGKVLQSIIPLKRAHGYELDYLNCEDVEKIHYFLVGEFENTVERIDPPGLASQSLLASAMMRGGTSFERYQKYPTVELAAAASLHSLTLNHVFHNGNKRTALVSTLVFLDKNGLSIDCPEDELKDFMTAIADHKLKWDHDYNQSDGEVLTIAEWIRSKSYRKTIPTRPIKFRELRVILQKKDCEFSLPMRGYVHITRNNLRVQIAYGGENREVRPNAIQKIRHTLQLDEMHGHDSAFFYHNPEKALPEFIKRYRKTLQLLALEE